MRRMPSTLALLALTTIGISGSTVGNAQSQAPGSVPVGTVVGTSVGSPAPATCTLVGTGRLAADVPIYNQRHGGTSWARFTGGFSALRAGPFPVQASERVPVITGTGTGSFRVEGFVDGSALPVVATRDIPIVPEHVWISARQPVTVVAGAPGKLQVRKDLRPPILQTFGAWASCDNFGLATYSDPTTWSVPAEARGHLVDADQIQLFAEPSAEGSPILSLAGAKGMLFWSKERRGTFIHVLYRGEIVVNAWAPASDFRLLPPGEISDGLVVPTGLPNAPQLRFEGAPRVVRTKGEVTFWNAANTKATALGRIEPGTETYVVDVIAGWVSVLPKSLNVAPQGDGRFWAKASDLGM